MLTLSNVRRYGEIKNLRATLMLMLLILLYTLKVLLRATFHSGIYKSRGLVNVHTQGVFVAFCFFGKHACYITFPLKNNSSM